MEPRKEAILTALRKFVRQRPGLEFANYGDVKAYQSEARSIQTDLRHAEELIQAVAWRDSITADDLIEAFSQAYSGRLQLLHKPVNRTDRTRVGRGDSLDAGFVLDYCTGQYFPTEYRKAVCAVLAAAIWDYTRSNMPEPREGTDGREYNLNGQWVSAGDWIRGTIKPGFGRGLFARYFR